MAEIVAKTGGLTGQRPKGSLSAGGDIAYGYGGEKTFICEVTTGGAETAGTVTFATYFGSLAANEVTAVVGGYTVQQDTLTNAGVVAFASWTAAGVATTGTIVAAKDYWVVFKCI